MDEKGNVARSFIVKKEVDDDPGGSSSCFGLCAL